MLVNEVDPLVLYVLCGRLSPGRPGRSFFLMLIRTTLGRPTTPRGSDSTSGKVLSRDETQLPDESLLSVSLAGEYACRSHRGGSKLHRKYNHQSVGILSRFHRL